VLAEFHALRHLGRLKKFSSCEGFSSHESGGDVMATATRSVHYEELDPQKRSSTSHLFEEELRQ
jgi:hypothetical protein